MDGQFLWCMAVGNGGTLDVCLVARDWVFFDAVVNVAAVVFFREVSEAVLPFGWAVGVYLADTSAIGQ